MAGKKQPAPTRPSSSKGGGAGKLTRNQKSPPQQTTTEDGESEEEELKSRQQTLLNIFSNTFREVLGADDFASQLQEVKGALFNRDFEGAFAREAALDVYAARWSPTRALCYARVLRGLDSHLAGLVSDTISPSPAHVDRSHDGLENDETSTKRKGGEGERETETARDEQGESAFKEEAVRNTEAVEQETSAEEQRDANPEEEESRAKPLKILAIGGAAAEIVAFADYISSHTSTSTTTTPFIRGAEITLLDIGPWESVISRLQTALTTTPPVSRYASAAAKAAAAANAALVAPPSRFRSTFIQKDILSLPEAELATLIPPKNNNTPVLITLLFTLNELYTAGGIKRTTAFLRLLSSSSSSSSSSIGLAPGSLLLVVDSPGSYSEAAVGGSGKDVMMKKKKRYPMQWLLEHTLIPPPSPPSRRPRGKEDKKEPGQVETEEKLDDDDADEEKEEEKKKSGIRWEKIESHDSVWFRVAEGLRYPIALENMRYQMHLYRACVG
ncbi:hypothetical protein F4782DRAFT_511613 [Xylaria castorea]|nr:hypothetical protein F4782DRAFT_511613 [Xylaria castorea]